MYYSLFIIYYLSFVTCHSLSIIHYLLNIVYFFLYIVYCFLFGVWGVGVRDQVVVLSHQLVVPHLRWEGFLSARYPCRRHGLKLS